MTILSFIFVLHGEKYKEYYFKLPAKGFNEVMKINEICSVDKVEDNFIYGYANEKQFLDLTTKYLDIEVLVNPSKTRNFTMANSVSEVREWDSYPTHTAYIETMNEFATNYPEICTVESIGTSIDGRDILVAKISDNVNVEEAEPEFYYSGQMHGDELVTSVLFLRLIDYLLENYGTDPQVTAIVNSSEIHINPISNPDGVYTDDDSTVFGATRYNANGIDLNRNFPGVNGVEHPDDNELQVENSMQINYANTNTFVMSSNSHSGAEVINYPWDYWARRHADDAWFIDVSRAYVDLVHEAAPNSYMHDYNDGITNGYDWYQVVGSRQDWFNYYNNCREITLELSNNKILAESLLDAHWNYNYEGMLNWLEQVNYGIAGVVTNSSGEPLEAKIEVVEHDVAADNSFVYTDPDVGDYHRPISAGTYSLQVSAEGYETLILEDIVVTDGNLTLADVELVESVSVDISGTVVDFASNSAIDEAHIFVSGSVNYHTTTDENGNFSIDEVLSGFYQFIVVKTGYTTHLADIQISPTSSTFDVTLAESQAESFETVLPQNWVSTTSIGWDIDNIGYDGEQSIKSGAIGDDDESAIEIEVNCTVAGVMTFYKKVSSEDNYDKLNFYIDNELIESWSGEIGWTEEIHAVNAGIHTFKWEYTKDGSVDEGSDCAWIDYVIFPLAPTPNNSDTSVVQVSSILASYPNPFNPEITINYFNSKADASSSLKIYNIKGQLVKNISNLNRSKGVQSVVWNGNDNGNNQVATGTYFVVLKSSGVTSTNKILLLK